MSNSSLVPNDERPSKSPVIDDVESGTAIEDAAEEPKLEEEFIVNSETQPFLVTNSLGNIAQEVKQRAPKPGDPTADRHRKSSHSFLNLFSRKSQPPPSTLEGIPSAVKIVPSKSGSKNELSPSSTTSFGSFLQRFYPHGGAQSSKQGSKRPEDLQFPVAEEDGGGEEGGVMKPAALTPAEDQWFEAEQPTAEHPVHLDDSEADLPPVKHRPLDKTLPFAFGPDRTETLDELLTDFRTGKMRSLTEDQLGQLREMHTKQLALATVFQRIYSREIDAAKMGNYDGTSKRAFDFDREYAMVSEQLDALHGLMDGFHLHANNATVLQQNPEHSSAIS